MSSKQGIDKLSLMWRMNMATKCKILMNCSKTFMPFKTNMTAKWEIVKGS